MANQAETTLLGQRLGRHRYQGRAQGSSRRWLAVVMISGSVPAPRAAQRQCVEASYDFVRDQQNAIFRQISRTQAIRRRYDQSAGRCDRLGNERRNRIGRKTISSSNIRAQLAHSLGLARRTDCGKSMVGCGKLRQEGS